MCKSVAVPLWLIVHMMSRADLFSQLEKIMQLKWFVSYDSFWDISVTSCCVWANKSIMPQRWIRLTGLIQ